MSKTNEYRFERIGVREGLSHAHVNCAMQDRQGFIWFGTSMGLSKYDGYKFKTYYEFKDSLATTNLAITSCFEDSNGTLWFGSTYGILLEYDPNNDVLVKHEINITSKLYPLPTLIKSICEDSAGLLWIATRGEGVYKFDKASKIGTRLNYDKNTIDKTESRKFIQNFLKTEKDELIIATDAKGIDILNLNTETYENIPINSISTNSRLNCICKLSDNEYLLGISSGLGIFYLDSKEILNFELPVIEKDFNFICQDREKNLWLGISNGGLIHVEFNTKNVKHFSSGKDENQSFGERRIQFMFNDMSNVMWFCTQSGVYKTDTIRKQFHSIDKFETEGKDIGPVSDLKIDMDNNLWVGTFLNNLYKYDLDREEVKHYNTIDKNGIVLNNPIIKEIFEDSRKNLWFGAEGLFKYVKEKDAFVEYENSREKGITKIFTISEYFQNSSHFILIGSNKPGITCIDTKTGSTTNCLEHLISDPKIKDRGIGLLYLDNEKNLWIQLLFETDIYKISNSGLFEYNPLNFKKNVQVLQMFEDSLNDLWFCTTDGLIMFTKSSGEIHHFNERDGLPSNVIRGVIEDNKNNFWVSSTFGITKFDKANNCFKNYDFDSGLLNEHFGSCCIDKNGILYFAGSNGVDYFNPEEIKDNPYIPNIVITDFQLLTNQSYHPLIILSYQKAVSIQEK